MIDKQTPLEIEGISESLYGGFWMRLGSLLLDFVIILPFVFLIQYLNGMGKSIYYYTIIPNLLFLLWYNVYLPKQYGGTPGKLLVGIRIIKVDGQAIDWSEAFLRHIVSLLLALLAGVIMIATLIKADDKTYTSVGWLERSQYLMSLSPLLFKLHGWASNIWIYSEFIVLLTNERKRAIHDFIAGTVIVKARYVDKIREVMN